MKKLFALAVLTLFALGFGTTASAEEGVRSNSPLSKVEPAMPKEAVPAKKEVVIKPQEKTESDENVAAPAENAEEDLMTLAKEDETPVPGDEPSPEPSY